MADAGHDGGHAAVALRDAPAAQLHLLPCAIDYSGPAKTAAYFLPEAQADGTYDAAFRGRQLRGIRVALPSGYTGHVLVEAAAAPAAAGGAFDDGACEAPEQLALVSAETFAAVTVWEHDRPPLPADDEFVRALAWADVAAGIHADCSEPGA
ncbi:Ribonuclease H2 subunit C [Coemansia javaensis]|uniref:Ribonuclease H2 subunit C n=1 Tax=Coemansia javaensis TaxID=2761396 RepID=A0A9W8HE41_9FUNG|nr:Ribonuclease H2 subunit C [Coemansia javaensis]